MRGAALPPDDEAAPLVAPAGAAVMEAGLLRAPSGGGAGQQAGWWRRLGFRHAICLLTFVSGAIMQAQRSTPAVRQPQLPAASCHPAAAAARRPPATRPPLVRPLLAVT